MATETEKKKEPQPIAICRSIKVLSCGEFVVVKAIRTQNGELCTRVKSAQQLYLLHIAFCFSFLLVVSLALVYRIIFRSPISNCNCFAVSCSQSWVQCTQNFPFLPSPHPHALLTATKQAVWTGGDGADTSSNLTAFRFLCFAALSFLFSFGFLLLTFYFAIDILWFIPRGIHHWQLDDAFQWLEMRQQILCILCRLRCIRSRCGRYSSVITVDAVVLCRAIAACGDFLLCTCHFALFLFLFFCFVFTF